MSVDNLNVPMLFDSFWNYLEKVNDFDNTVSFADSQAMRSAIFDNEPYDKYNYQ